jgi:hypothetical protein
LFGIGNTSEVASTNTIVFNAGMREFISNRLVFNYTIVNKTGRTITGIDNVSLELYVDNIKRASAYFGTVNCGKIENGESFKWNFQFPHDTIDYDFWIQSDKAYHVVTVVTYAYYDAVY